MQLVSVEQCKNPNCTRDADKQRKGFCQKCYMAEYRKNKTATATTPATAKKTEPIMSTATATPATATPATATPANGNGNGNGNGIDMISAGIFQVLENALSDIKTSSNMSEETQKKLYELELQIEENRDELALQHKAIKKLQESLQPTVISIPETGKMANVGLAHHKLPLIVLTAKMLPVMLVGPSGSGKTHLGEQVAQALSLPFFSTGAILQKYELLGFIGPQGLTRTTFRDAYEHGGVFLWDEIDASNPAALVAFNQALANGHCAFPDGMIKRHKDFVCLASANTYGRGSDRVYVGRNQLDGATLNRFAVIDLDYDTDLELALAGLPVTGNRKPQTFKTLSPDQMQEITPKWVKSIQDWREAVAKLEIRHLVTMRAVTEGLKLLQAGIKESVVADMLVWQGLNVEQIKKIQATAKEL